MKDWLDDVVGNARAAVEGDEFKKSISDFQGLSKEVKAPKRTVSGTIKDVGITAAKAAIGVPEAAVGLLDIPTGGRAGKALESAGFRPGEAREELDLAMSPAQRAAKAKVSGAEGIVDTAVAAIQNPSVIAETIGESLPLMLAGGAVAQGLGKVAPAMSAAARAAAGEGIIGGGSAAEGIRQQTDTGLMTAKQSGLALASGAGTGLFGFAGNKLSKYLGVDDIDVLLATTRGERVASSSAKNVVRRTISGMVSEGLLEELPQSVNEQVMSNLALDRDITEGLDHAAVLGFLSGAVMGGVVGATTRPPAPAPTGPLTRALTVIDGPSIAEAVPVNYAQNAQLERPVPDAEFVNIGQSRIGFSPQPEPAPQRGPVQYGDTIPQARGTGAIQPPITPEQFEAEGRLLPYSIEGRATPEQRTALVSGALEEKAREGAGMAAPEIARAAKRVKREPKVRAKDEIVITTGEKALEYPDAKAPSIPKLDSIKTLIDETVSIGTAGRKIYSADKKQTLEAVKESTGKPGGQKVYRAIEQRDLDFDEENLVPNPGSTHTAVDGSPVIATWWTTSKQEAEEIAGRSKGKGATVAEMNISDIPGSTYLQNTDTAGGLSNLWVGIPSGIPKSKITTTSAPAAAEAKGSAQEAAAAKETDGGKHKAFTIKGENAQLDDYVFVDNGERVKMVGRDGETRNAPVFTAQKIRGLVAKGKSKDFTPTGKGPLQVHDYSNTQIAIDGPAARKLLAFGKNIPDSALYVRDDDDSDGREKDPHVTVRYGLDTDNPADIAALSSLPPITVTMGEVSIFENDDFDVVKVEVDGDSLRAANKLIGDTVPLPGETFKTYNPHATIAYVKKGEGKKYVGNKALEGETITVSKIELTDRSGETHIIELKGEPTDRDSLSVGRGIDSDAHDAATSPENNIKDPSLEQIGAGNYKKGHVRLYGLDISIENPAGSERTGVDEAGHKWAVEMAHHYGYIKGTVGKDKDHLDVFIKPGVDDATVGDVIHVVDQNDPGTGKFDEHKILFGFSSTEKARSAYLENYDKTGPDRIGAITEASEDQFKEWLSSGNTTRVFSGQVEEIDPFDSDDRQAALAAATDIRENASASGKLVIGGHAKKGTISANSITGRWYLDAGYASDEVAAALTAHGNSKTPTPKQKEIINAWMESLDRDLANAGITGTVFDDEVYGALEDGDPRLMMDAYLAAEDVDAGAAEKIIDKAESKSDVEIIRELKEIADGDDSGSGKGSDKKKQGSRDRSKAEKVKVKTDPKAAEIGRNTAGKMVRTDDFGNRYYHDKGIQISASVSFVPGRQPGIKSAAELFRSGSFDFLTADEKNRFEGVQADAETKPADIDAELADLDMDDLSAMFDEVAAEKEVPTKAAKAEAPKKEQAPVQQKPKDDDTASKIAAKAAKHGVKGVDEAMKGLVELFGGKAVKSFPAGLDRDTYDQAKPHFQKAFEEFRAAGKGVKDFLRFVIENFSPKVKPYLMHYLDEVKSGDTVKTPGAIDKTETGRGGQPDGKIADGNGISGDEEGRISPAQQDSPPADTGNLAGKQPPADEGTKPEDDGGETGLRPTGKDVEGEGRPDKVGDAADRRGGAGREGMADAGTRSGRGDGRVDFHIADPLAISGGGQYARFNKNKAAIELINEITAEARQASPEEQVILAGYTGWGSFGQEMFKGSWPKPSPKEGWEARDGWLRNNLGRGEWESAQRSILNAHYTDPPTVMAIWNMLDRMGFKGGKVLEPAMGIGNFFGMMPAKMKKRSQLTGIELDELTGKMAMALYPKSNINIKGYEESKTPDNFYDLVIGNWPFADSHPADRRYQKINPVLHDYFFLKALDQVRPGGLVVGITSHGTMDKAGNTARRAMAQKGELVAAFRLPTGAFKEYAGTAVVTDIIVLRKRAAPLGLVDDSWIQSAKYKTPGGEEVNLSQFYIDNPGNVIGKVDYGHGTTSFRPGLIVKRPSNMAGQLERITAMVPEDGFRKDPRTDHISYITNHTDDRQNSVTETADGLFVVRGEHLAPANEVLKYEIASKEGTADRIAQIVHLISLRKNYASLIDAETSGTGATAKRTALRSDYEAFVKKHGPVSDSFGLKYMDRVKDPFYPAIAALEIDGKPAKILTKSTTRPVVSFENPTTSDAFVLARNIQVSPTLAEVAALANKPEDEVRKDLVSSGAAFETLDRDIIPGDIYLSGNVRSKLRDAEQWVSDGNDHLSRNVDALKKVMPEDVPYHEVEVQMGATWVPDSDYSQYVAHMLNLTEKKDVEKITTKFTAGRWKISFPSNYNLRSEAVTGFGSKYLPFRRLVNAAISNQAITIKREDEKGVQHVNDAATTEVAERISRIREDFGAWVWGDAERRVSLEREYNEARNAYAKPVFDGAFMTFEGMSLTLGENPFNLRKHQVDAVWRALVTRRSLNAHEVGTGKTFTMGGIAVESRRYGIAKKPLLLAHNANSATVSAEIQSMYPSAKILYVDNLSPATIDVKLRQIANDDWDVIVMPHSLIDRLSLSEKTLTAMAQSDIDAFEQEAREAAEDDGVEWKDSMLTDDEELKKLRSPTAKDLVKARNRIIENIKKSAQRASREGAISFEELGIDMIMVDEAHEFKKPPIVTKMRMKGLNAGTSNKSIALQFLTRYIRANNGGGNVHLFTGTPITNTLTEVFHQMRYIMEDEMADTGIDSWDGWFGSFAAEVSDVELNAASEYESVTRLASFINVPELRRMFGQYMDVVFSDDMPEMIPRKTGSGKTADSKDLTDRERIELENGRTENAVGRPYKKVIIDSADMTPPQLTEFKKLQGYAQDWRDMSPLERKKTMMAGGPESPIITEGLASKASMDVRLLDGEKLAGKEGQAKDHDESKASRLVKSVLEIYQSNDKACQAVFTEIGLGNKATRSEGVPGAKTKRTFPIFSTVDDIVARLVAGGIPREEIAVVRGGTSKQKRKEISQAMNEARIRVVVGNSQTLGVGVNMQKNLRAMHHMDAPWMPGDLEQRNGRGHRQGNQWNTVLEYRYITDRLDGRRWQVLLIKDRFIKEFLRANETTRVIEGDAAADEQNDILETFSNASGDPRILLLEKSKKKVDKLRSRERVHTRAIADAKKQGRFIEEDIQDVKSESSLMNAPGGVVSQVSAALANNKGENFRATWGNKKFTERNKAAAGLEKTIEKSVRQGANNVAIGEIYGFRVSASFSRLAEEPFLKISIPTGPGTDHEIHTNRASIASIDGSLRSEIKRGESAAGRIADLTSSLNRMEKVAGEPFAREEELKIAETRVSDLQTDMEQNPVPAPAWLRNGTPVDTEVFRNGGRFIVTGHRWTSDGWFVLAEDEKGQTVIPYGKAMDIQGLPIYDKKEFSAPDAVIDGQDDSGSGDAAFSLAGGYDEKIHGNTREIVSEEFQDGRDDNMVAREITQEEAYRLQDLNAGHLVARVNGYDTPGEKGWYFLDRNAEVNRRTTNIDTGIEGFALKDEARELAGEIYRRKKVPLEMRVIRGFPSLINPVTFDPDSPDTRFSRSSGKRAFFGKDKTLDTATKIARALGIKNPSGKVRVVATEADLPRAIIDQARKSGAAGNIRGVAHQGKIYIVADKITSALDVETVMLHEAVHIGGDAAFGKSKKGAYQRLFLQLGGLKGILALSEKHGFDMSEYFKAADAMMAKITESTSKKDRQRIIGRRNEFLIDEALAFMGQMRAGESLPAKIKRIVQEFVGKVRDMLRAGNFEALAAVSDSDLFFLLKRVNSAVAGSEGGGAIRFMTGDGPALPGSIDIDGIQRPTSNSNGQPIAQSEEGARNFWKWFGDSRVVDDEGRPLVVYHGTPGRQRIVELAFDKEEFKEHRKKEGVIWDEYRAETEDIYKIENFQMDPILYEKTSTAVKKREKAIAELGQGPKRRGVEYVGADIEGGAFRVDESGDIGVHFGTAEQAAEFAGDNGSIFPVYLNIGKMTRVPDIFGRFGGAREAVVELEANGVMKRRSLPSLLHSGESLDALWERLDDERELGESSQNKNFWKSMNKAIDRKKVDGFIYTNEVEGKGMDSYVAFSPNQIKSATGNIGEFSSETDDIMFSRVPSGQQGGSVDTSRSEDIRAAVNEGKKNAKEWAGDRLDYLRMKFQDRFITLKRVQESLIAKGWAIKESANAFLKEELSSGKIEDRIELFDKDHVAPLKKAIADEKIDVVDLESYLYARHAKERNAYIQEINPEFEDGGSGMTDSEADGILAGFTTDGKTAALARLAKRVDAMTAMQRKIIGDSGLETDETLEAWGRYKHYVPLKGTPAGMEDGFGRSIGRGLNVRKSGARKALGRRSSAENILGNTVAQVMDSIVRSEKAAVGLAFLEMVEQNPDTSLWVEHTAGDRNWPTTRSLVGGVVRELPDHLWSIAPNVLAVTRDGKIHYIEIKDADLARVMGNMNPAVTSKMVRVMGSVTRTLAKINTSLNPEFMITNFERDLQEAMIHISGEQSAKAAKDVVVGIPAAMKAIRSALRGKPGHDVGEMEGWFTKYKAAGAKVGFMDLVGVDSLQKKIERDVSMAGKHPALQKTGQFFSDVGKLIGDYNTVLENAVRLSAFKTASQNGATDSEAASIAKNLTVNFNRRGELSSAMNSAFMFFNAGVQGSTRVVKALKNPRVRKIAMGIVAAGVALAEMSRLSAGDDDDDVAWWDKVSDHTKTTNLIFLREDGSLLKVRMPYGYNVFIALGYAIDDTARYAATGGKQGKSPARAMAFVIKAAAGAFNPLGGEGSLLQTISPTLLDPFVQVSENKNFFGGQIMPADRLFGTPQPDSQRYFSSVREPSRKAAEWLNEITGGNKYQSGGLDVSPETLDTFYDFATGGLGRFVADAPNIPKAILGADVETRRVPFLRQTTQDRSEHYDRSLFYENTDRVEGVHATYKDLLISNPGEAFRYTKDNPEIRLVKRMREANKALKSFRSGIRQVEASTLGEVEKSARVKSIQQRVEALYKSFNKEYASGK